MSTGTTETAMPAAGVAKSGRAAGRIWVQHLTTGLSNIRYKQSKVDKSDWYKGDIIFTSYVDD